MKHLAHLLLIFWRCFKRKWQITILQHHTMHVLVTLCFAWRMINTHSIWWVENAKSWGLILHWISSLLLQLVSKKRNFESFRCKETGMLLNCVYERSHPSLDSRHTPDQQFYNPKKLQISSVCDDSTLPELFFSSLRCMSVSRWGPKSASIGQNFRMTLCCYLLPAFVVK